MSGSGWVDEPISDRANDTLGRAAYAHRIADLISDSHTYEASLVFGLTGPWGSGKSSLAELVEEHLRAFHPDWIIVRFTPWAAGDVNSLLADYYSALLDALPQARQRRLKKSLGAMAAIVAPLATAIPVAGSSAAEVIKMAGQRLTASPDYASAFKDASAQILSLRRPLLVIADDIDRLHREELLAFLKVVRLVGRFPGVNYLIAYDESTVHRALDTGSPGSVGRDFMEKIVQYPLSVPAFSEQQLFQRLNQGLASALEAAGRINFEEGALSHAADLLKGQLRTPRSVNRYIAQVANYLSMMPEQEIDDVDLMLVTLLRLSFPSVYRDLPRWRSHLLSGNTGEFDSAQRGGQIRYKPFDPAHLVSGLGDRDRHQALDLLRLLFPALQNDGLTYRTGRASRGIRDENYFDRYLAMGVPEYDVPDSSVAEALDALEISNLYPLLELMQEVDHQRSSLILDKVRKAVESRSFSSAQRLDLLRTYARIVDNLADQKQLFFSTRDTMRVLMGDLIASLDALPFGKTEIYNALAAASIGIRLEAYERSGRAREMRPVPDWWEELGDHLAIDCVDLFVSHVIEGDDAEDQPTHYLADFAVRYGREFDLRARLQDGIRAGDIDPENVAARLVTGRTILGRGARLELHEFNGNLWKLLIPDERDRKLSAPDGEVDRFDVSWRNKRFFARSFLAGVWREED